MKCTVMDDLNECPAEHLNFPLLVFSFSIPFKSGIVPPEQGISLILPGGDSPDPGPVWAHLLQAAQGQDGF